MNLDRMLNQTLTYWAPTQRDIYGKTGFAAPVQIGCRWEDKVENYIDKKGETRNSKSKVFMSQDCELDGFVFLGTSVVTDPTTLAGAFEIQQKTKIPDLRSMQNLVCLYL